MPPPPGAPTLGLFGPSDDRLYAHLGAINARALRSPRSFEQFKAIDPNLDLAINHMRDLPVEWVVRDARRLLQETRSPPPPHFGTAPCLTPTT